MTQNIRDFFVKVEKMSSAANNDVSGAVGRECLRLYLSTELIDSEDVFIDYIRSLKNKVEVEEAQMMVVLRYRGLPK